VQFSGYCDIAIGLSAAMGFKVRENFDRPYLAHNISDFWRRWHMSLTSWCRDYVYVPVLALSRLPLLALAASMVALSLWHAVSLHYLIWGLYQTAGIALHRAFHARTAAHIEALPPWGRRGWNLAARFLTVNFIILSFPAASAVEQLAGGWAR
jgi:D-alanyl-lipoteichoic acid acyltransferase DltB (MBOAT superfamily)